MDKLRVFAVLLLVGGCGDEDSDQAITFQVTLTTAAESPPCAGAGASASGSAMVTIDAAESTITVSNLIFTDLSGPATGAHIHFGATSVAGGIALDFGSDPVSPVSDTFTVADYHVPAGGPATFAAFITAMKAGMTYINVHTDACMAGEIRGQIQ